MNSFPINVTVALDPEDRKRFDQLLKELGAFNRNLARTNIAVNKLAPEAETLPDALSVKMTPTTDLKPEQLEALKNAPVQIAPAEPAQVTATHQQPAELPVEEPVQHGDAPLDLPTEPATEAPEPADPAPIPLAEFQKKIVAMCVDNPAKKANIQAVVKGYAKCVSAIPEDKRAEVLRRLEELVK